MMQSHKQHSFLTKIKKPSYFNQQPVQIIEARKKNSPKKQDKRIGLSIYQNFKQQNNKEVNTVTQTFGETIQSQVTQQQRMQHLLKLSTKQCGKGSLGRQFKSNDKVLVQLDQSMKQYGSQGKVGIERETLTSIESNIRKKDLSVVNTIEELLDTDRVEQAIKQEESLNLFDPQIFQTLYQQQHQLS